MTLSTFLLIYQHNMSVGIPNEQTHQRQSNLQVQHTLIGSQMADLHMQQPGYKSSVNLFFLPSAIRLKASWLYYISDAHANSHSNTSSSHLPSQCILTYFLLECHPCNLHGISTKNTRRVLFILGTRCISYNFYLTRIKLPLLHW